jgi:hypothetical protein
VVSFQLRPGHARVGVVLQPLVFFQNGTKGRRLDGVDVLVAIELEVQVASAHVQQHRGERGALIGKRPGLGKADLARCLDLVQRAPELGLVLRFRDAGLGQHRLGVPEPCGAVDVDRDGVVVTFDLDDVLDGTGHPLIPTLLGGDVVDAVEQVVVDQLVILLRKY